MSEEDMAMRERLLRSHEINVTPGTREGYETVYVRDAMEFAEQEKQALRAEVERKDAALRFVIDRLEEFEPCVRCIDDETIIYEAAKAALSPATREPDAEGTVGK